MFWQFILNFGRSVRSNKVLTLINIFSLSLGLTVFAIAFSYVQRELNYDHGWPNADRIHRLVIRQQGLTNAPDGLSHRVDPASYRALLGYFSDQIEAATRLATIPVQLQVGEEDIGGINFLTLVDPEFESIFSLEVLEGSLNQVLNNPGLIALSETRAQALGDSGRVGQRLRAKAPYNGGEQEFVVGAIVRLPERTAHSIDMLALIGDYSAALASPPSIQWEASTPIRLMLKPGERTQDINNQMPQFVESALVSDGYQFQTGNISDHLFYELQPIKEIYLNRTGFEEDGLIFGDKAKVLTFAVVGLLVLLVGGSNSASLSFANALRRRREVGIHKVLGAGKKNIVLHYLGESVLLALISLGLALVLFALLLAPVQILFNVSGELSLGTSDFVLLAIIAALIGVINGIYPAFVLSGLHPQSVLKPSMADDGKGVFRARALLLGGQLTLTVMFLASAFSLYAQLKVTQDQPLGYDHRNLLYFSHPPSSSAPSTTATVNNVLNLPGVVAATPMVTIPPNMNLPLNINAVNLVAKNEQETEVQATRLMIAEGFPEMLGIPLIAGRTLDTERDSWTSSRDIGSQVEHALINRRATETLGFAAPEQAVDQLVYMRRFDESGQPLDAPLLIVGVLEDNLYSSIHRLPVPELYAIPSEIDVTQFMLRFDSSASNNIQEDVVALFEPYNIDLNFMFIENRIEGAFFQERNESRLLLIAAGMALLLSCIGMYGLVAATVVRNVKEVGVRKVLGATTASILGLFIWRFSWPALFANLIAWPLAIWFVVRWIQRFPYQIDLVWLLLIFLGASLVVQLVVWLTIIPVTARAAQSVPAVSLRYE